MIEANNPNLRSWIDVPADSDFPIQNLPFGIFKPSGGSPRVGVAIGEHVLDLKTLHVLGYLESLPFSQADFDNSTLNDLMRHGKKGSRELRNRISKLLRSDVPYLRDKEHHVQQVLHKQSEVELLMPVKVGDYTDFYSSRDHATNIGKMLRDPNNALLPNWLHLPVAYHGRASSIVVSGTPTIRPCGQTRPNDDEPPVFGPSKLLDFELEMAFITFEGKPLGERISTSEADDYIFGMVIFNDWSARDIQKWEYVPLGPFLAKNFNSVISPWVVTLDALEPFRCTNEKQSPEVLPYLQFSGDKGLDINLEVLIQPNGGNESRVCLSNYKFMYWNMNQQLAHHTVNGCNIHAGDMMASGTISGPTKDSFGSMMELSWRGQTPVVLNDGSERKFLLDGDTVVMRGWSEKDGVRVGFGEVRSMIEPARD